MKTPIFLLICFSLLSATAHARELLKGEYELEKGCKAAVSGTHSGNLEVRVDSGTMYARFEFDSEGNPTSGPNICNSYDHDVYPEVVKEEYGDFVRYNYVCGGSFSVMDSKAEIVVQRKTGKVSRVHIDQSVAYAPLPFITHSGPIKSSTDSFSCESKAYKNGPGAAFAAADLHKLFTKINGSRGQSMLSKESGRVVRGKFEKYHGAGEINEGAASKSDSAR